MPQYQELMKLGHVQSTGLAKEISETLIKGIINGFINEGEQLVEADLQKHFAVSKSPIREALKHLGNIGLVEIKPRRGAFVRVIKKEDIIENYKIRTVLEALAAKEAYSAITPEKIDDTLAAYAKMEEAADRGNARKYWEYHHLFHDSYLKAAGLPMLSNILNNLRIQNLWYRNQFFFTDIKNDLLTHIETVEHFRKQDTTPDHIEHIVREHIEKGLSNFLKYSEKRNND